MTKAQYLNGFSCHLAAMGRKHNLKSIRTGFSHSGTSDMFRCLIGSSSSALHIFAPSQPSLISTCCVINKTTRSGKRKKTIILLASRTEKCMHTQEQTHRVTQKVIVGQLCFSETISSLRVTITG